MARQSIPASPWCLLALVWWAGCGSDEGSSQPPTDIVRSEPVVPAVGIAAGGSYVAVNERDRKQTQADLDELKQEMSVVTVNVTNSNGSVSQVRLKKQPFGYVGPNGEHYDHLPTDGELRVAYGF